MDKSKNHKAYAGYVYWPLFVRRKVLKLFLRVVLVISLVSSAYANRFPVLLTTDVLDAYNFELLNESDQKFWFNNVWLPEGMSSWNVEIVRKGSAGGFGLDLSLYSFEDRRDLYMSVIRLAITEADVDPSLRAELNMGLLGLDFRDDGFTGLVDGMDYALGFTEAYYDITTSAEDLIQFANESASGFSALRAHIGDNLSVLSACISGFELGENVGQLTAYSLFYLALDAQACKMKLSWLKEYTSSSFDPAFNAAVQLLEEEFAGYEDASFWTALGEDYENNMRDAFGNFVDLGLTLGGLIVSHTAKFAHNPQVAIVAVTLKTIKLQIGAIFELHERFESIRKASLAATLYRNRFMEMSSDGEGRTEMLDFFQGRLQAAYYFFMTKATNDSDLIADFEFAHSVTVDLLEDRKVRHWFNVDDGVPEVEFWGIIAGDILSGSLFLRARSPDTDIMRVSFYGSLDGHNWSLLGTGELRDDGALSAWEVEFDTTEIGNYTPSTYWLRAVAEDSFGNFSEPSIISVTIDNRDRPDYQLSVRGGPLAFQGIAPGSTAKLSYTVRNSGKNTASFTPGVNVSWITSIQPLGEITLASGQYRTLTVEVDTSGLSLGTNKTTTITHSSPDGSMSDMSVSLSVAPGAEDGQAELFASADTFVDEWFNRSNWGGDSRMKVADDPDATSNRGEKWAMMQFAADALGSETITVTKATLRIYCSSLGGDAGSERIYVHIPSNSWVEGTATGQSQAGSVIWDDVSVDPGASYESRDKDNFSISSTGWREVDVTSWANTVLRSGSTRSSYEEKGMLLRYHGTPDAYHYFSTSDTSMTPSLKVEYIEKDGVDPTVAITSHSEGEIVSSETVTISGTAYDASGMDRVEVNGDDANTSNNWATWSKTVTLSEGKNTIRVGARDKSYQSMDDVLMTLYHYPPQLAIHTNPKSLTVERGGAGNVAVLVSGANGFNSSVSLSTGGAAAGVSTSLGETSVTASGSTNLRFEVGQDAALGKTNITVSGTGGGKADTASIELNVIAPPSYVISILDDPGTGGTTSADDIYFIGERALVWALPNLGYDFVGWTENGSLVSTDAIYTFTAVENRNLVAEFVKESRLIAVAASPLVGGIVSGVGEFDYGSERTVTATPNTSYKFVRWSENETEVSTEASYTFTLTANRNLVAEFSVENGTTIVGDLNDSGNVDIFDLVIVSNSFGRVVGDLGEPAWLAQGDNSSADVADLNDDGRVDIFDLVVVSNNFGMSL